MKQFLTLAILAFCASSCIQEDYSHCPSLTELLHYYTLNSQEKNRLDEEVDSLKIMIFDKNQVFSHYEEVVAPTNSSTVEVRLPESTYTALTIGGEHSALKIIDGASMRTPAVGATLLKNVLVALPEGVEPTEFFMSVPTEFTAASMEQKVVEIPLVKMLKTVTLRVIGAPDHEAMISIKHGLIGYDGYPDPASHTVNYTEEGTLNGDTVTYVYKVLRLYDGDESAIIKVDFALVQNQMQRIDGSSVTIPLMSTIQQNPDYSDQESLDKESNFNVDVKFGGEVGIEVAINGWIVKNVTPY